MLDGNGNHNQSYNLELCCSHFRFEVLLQCDKKLRASSQLDFGILS